jgi:hypothetical protein
METSNVTETRVGQTISPELKAEINGSKLTFSLNQVIKLMMISWHKGYYFDSDRPIGVKQMTTANQIKEMKEEAEDSLIVV